MNTKTYTDYLRPGIEQIRHSIRGIDDSYNNPWDIFAELIQNAIDAIRQNSGNNGRVDIEIDCPNKSIIIYDDGIGINKGTLPDLLKPFSTNKTTVNIAIGEKGVGLKFVIFNSSYFHIKSGNSTGVSEAIIVDAISWKNSTSDQLLELKYSELVEDYRGTLVEVKGVNNSTIFNLNFEQFKYLLRTKTALGSTKAIWNGDKSITVSLKVIDNNNIIKSEIIPFKYFLITDCVDNRSKIDLDDFINWVNESDKTDSEKRSKIKDKIIYKQGEFIHNDQRVIKYYACFVPKRSVWNSISLEQNLVSSENIDNENWFSDYYFLLFSNGITVSVKGMPTGILIDPPSTGYAGYWSNIFILFEDSTINFDIGRKSIHGRTANVHREYAKRIFNDFLMYVTRYVSGDVVLERMEWNREDIFNEIENLIDINCDSVKFKKAPSTQEASVAAIFYECIGKGIIKDIIPLTSGYRNKYDLYAKWDNKKIIIEFKSKLKNIVKDFNDIRKMFDEMDCIVCWGVTDDDLQALRNINLNIEEISISRFAQNTRIIPNSTHVMNINGFINPIYIIDLKKILMGLV